MSPPVFVGRNDLTETEAAFKFAARRGRRGSASLPGMGGGIQPRPASQKLKNKACNAGPACLVSQLFLEDAGNGGRYQPWFTATTGKVIYGS